MSNMIYGSFEDLAVGARLADELNTADAIGTFAIAHGRHLREEEIQYPGTLSLRYSVMGALLVGLLGAFLVWTILLPQLGMPLSAWALVPLFTAIAPFGVIAGVVSGAAECKPPLAGLAERTESDDRTLVTAEIPHSAIAATVAAFRGAGALDVCIA
jgi:hypothetical protein